ncbi:MAG: pyrimidine 5'-nucleotidase [Propionivibrio sp.]|nr:pyrimidine 5'-nucleotidase [Propionivibrio sp.]
MADGSRTWLFDLDNTLHDVNPSILPHIDRSMTAYIREHLCVDEGEAARLRRHYWLRYGATLLGLMRHHGTDPEHFLHHTHQFPDLASSVIVERGLKAMLRRLKGRKIIFSNAPFKYTSAVLAIIGIRHCFDAIYTVERLRFQPKPAVSGFLHLLHKEELDPRSCIMVEDTQLNLKTAKRLGMRTVWVSTCTRHPPDVDVKLASVLDLPQRLGRL